LIVKIPVLCYIKSGELAVTFVVRKTRRGAVSLRVVDYMRDVSSTPRAEAIAGELSKRIIYRPFNQLRKRIPCLS